MEVYGLVTTEEGIKYHVYGALIADIKCLLSKGWSTTVMCSERVILVRTLWLRLVLGNLLECTSGAPPYQTQLLLLADSLGLVRT